MGNSLHTDDSEDFVKPTETFTISSEEKVEISEEEKISKTETYVQLMLESEIQTSLDLTGDDLISDIFSND